MNPTIHDEAELWAAAAVTGGLSAAELKAWNVHLQACPACRKLHEEELTMADLIKKTLETDRESDSQSPDAGFEQRIISRLDLAGMGKGNRWYEQLLFHPGLTVAAACLVATTLAGAGWALHWGTPAKVAAPGDVAGAPTPSSQGQRSVIAAAATPAAPAAEETKAVTPKGNADKSPSGLNPVVVENQPPTATGEGLSIGEGTRVNAFSPRDNDGRPSFSLTNPNTKYNLDPGTEQKIETIAATHPANFQETTAVPSKDAKPASHHKHRRHPHHKRHRRHHHHPAAPPASAVLPLSTF